MFRKVLAGAALALGVVGGAQAAGPLSVDTPFPAPISPVETFKADLESMGVGVELASPTFVTVDPGTTLTFRLLASLEGAGGLQVTKLVVGPSAYDIGPQAFSSPGTLLGSQLFSGSFTAAVGFNDSLSGGDAPPLFWPNAFRVFIRSADEGNLSGIGPFIGDFDTLYFTVADVALFQVTSGAVPEPADWILMIAGLAMTGAVLRRSRRSLPVRLR
jgi:hypothetical protein